MGFLKDLSIKKQKKLIEQQELESLKSSRESLESDIRRRTKYLEDTQYKLSQFKEMREKGEYNGNLNVKYEYIEMLLNNPKVLDSEIADLENDVIRQEQFLIQAKDELNYMRINSQKDIEERERAIEKFSTLTINADPQNILNLRFHSTSLPIVKEIIESGGLMSPADRIDGYMETNNYNDEISVYGIENIHLGLKDWTGIKNYQRNLPCGCMFALKPKDQQEADMLSVRRMHNVYFHKNPEQLFAIITTSENIPKLQEWLESNGLDKNVAVTFEEFPLKLEREVAKNSQINIATALNNLTEYTKPHYSEERNSYEDELHIILSRFGETNIKNFATQIYAISRSREEAGLQELNTRDVLELAIAFESSIPLAYYANQQSFREMHDITKKLLYLSDECVRLSVHNESVSPNNIFNKVLKECENPDFTKCNSIGQESIKNTLSYFNIESNSSQHNIDSQIR